MIPADRLIRQDDYERRGENDAAFSRLRAQIAALQTELDDLNTAYGLTAAALERRVREPNTTMGASPTEGVLQYETDTDLLRVWNGSNWVTQTNLRIFGAGNTTDGGSAPAIDTGDVAFKLQAGTTVVITDGGGGAGITYPTPFPNGVLSIVLCNGDGGAKDDAIMSVEMGHASTNLSGIWFISTASNATRIASAALRVNWLAIGW